MKKIIALFFFSIAFVASVSAASFGVRGDVDLIYESEWLHDVYFSADGGTVGVWLDCPVINLHVFSLGIRPDLEFAFNQRINFDWDAGISTNDFNANLFLTTCFNFFLFRYSLGVGPYVSWSLVPLGFAPNANWAAPNWGLSVFNQFGIGFGVVFLLFDARVTIPFAARSLSSPVFYTSEMSKTDIGLGLEFLF